MGVTKNGGEETPFLMVPKLRHTPPSLSIVNTMYAMYVYCAMYVYYAMYVYCAMYVYYLLLIIDLTVLLILIKPLLT